ncbi:MAG: fibronectin type III domain-containing protein [Bacteroidota bacterium]
MRKRIIRALAITYGLVFTSLLASIISITIATILVPAVPAVTAGSYVGRETPDQVALSWVDDPRTTVAIKWRTRVDVTGTQVEYWEAPAGEPAADTSPDSVPPADRQQVSGLSFEWTSNLGSMRIHEVQLTGLKPGTRYAYRVGDGSSEGWSAVHYFTTAPEAAGIVSILVFGDSQSYATNYNLWRQTLQTALKDDLAEQFILHTGDLVDVGSAQLHWETWFRATCGVLEKIPFFPALGNHENARGGAVCLQTHFQLPTNGPEELRELVYSFTYGNVHVVILNSEASGSAIEAQRRFLEEDLVQHQDKTWKIVVFHRTAYNVKWGRGNPDLIINYTPVFERYGVDLVLNGHDHSYARSFPIRAGQTAASPTDLSGGVVYIVTGRSGVKTYTDTFQPQWAAAFGDGTRQPNYINLIFQGRQVHIISRYVDGTVIDDVVLSK